MNRRKFEEHLRDHGCELDHHGRRHDIWVNKANNQTSPVPRHKTVSRGTVRGICRQLEIPLPDGF